MTLLVGWRDKIPVNGRTKYIIVASFYGIWGSASHEKKKAMNEVLLSDAFRRVVESETVPYFLCGDIDINLVD